MVHASLVGAKGFSLCENCKFIDLDRIFYFFQYNNFTQIVSVSLIFFSDTSTTLHSLTTHNVTKSPVITRNKIMPSMTTLNKKKENHYGIIIGTITGVLLLTVLAIFLKWYKLRKQGSQSITRSLPNAGLHLHDHLINSCLFKWGGGGGGIGYGWWNVCCITSSSILGVVL